MCLVPEASVLSSACGYSPRLPVSVLVRHLDDSLGIFLQREIRDFASYDLVTTLTVE